MTRQLLRTMLVAAICAVPGAGFATDKVEARTVAMPSQIAAASFAAEDVAISINAGPEEIWSGTLRIGGPSGSANFSLSKNEFARPCPDDPDAASCQTMSSLRVNFNMSRRNWN